MGICLRSFSGALATVVMESIVMEEYLGCDGQVKRYGGCEDGLTRSGFVHEHIKGAQEAVRRQMAHRYGLEESMRVGMLEERVSGL